MTLRGPIGNLDRPPRAVPSRVSIPKDVAPRKRFLRPFVDFQIVLSSDQNQITEATSIHNSVSVAARLSSLIHCSPFGWFLRDSKTGRCLWLGTPSDDSVAKSLALRKDETEENEGVEVIIRAREGN